MMNQIVSIPNYTKLLKEVKPKGIDHIAYRSFNKPFIPKGIKQPEEYVFKSKNVKAHWYKTHFDHKRIFTSWFDLEKCDKNWKSDLTYFVNCRMNNIDLKHLMSFNQFKTIFEFSQYVAWTLVHLNNINHVALEVNDITICEELRQKDFVFHETNNSIYNVSKDKKLIQASLIPELVNVEFSDGVYQVPGPFVEIIERHREGFETDNADTIFDSTKVLKL